MGHDHHHDDAAGNHTTTGVQHHDGHHSDESKSISRALVMAVLAACIFAGILFFRQGQAKTPDSVTLPANHMGATEATVVIVEASDFQCPYCARVQTAIGRLIHEYPNEVRLEFRHNPLSFHDQAIPAAAAAVAAARQGRFWDMHAALFRRVNRLNNDTINEAAQEIGLNMQKFAEDRNSPSVMALVEQDQVAVTTMGARGTPTFFINGLVVKGAQPYPVLRTIVRDQIVKARRLTTEGLTSTEAQLTLVAQQAANPEQYVQLLGTQPLAALGNGAAIEWKRVETPE
ncbi:MAG: thioredoxin domain-containing protein [Myxococcales bacterium]|nr:thioredoxin domain-containing protein [Myxococcales bacterium]